MNPARSRRKHKNPRFPPDFHAKTHFRKFNSRLAFSSLKGFA
jgi:hypothetical protein